MIVYFDSLMDFESVGPVVTYFVVVVDVIDVVDVVDVIDVIDVLDVSEVVVVAVDDVDVGVTAIVDVAAIGPVAGSPYLVMEEHCSML